MTCSAIGCTVLCMSKIRRHAERKFWIIIGPTKSLKNIFAKHGQSLVSVTFFILWHCSLCLYKCCVPVAGPIQTNMASPRLLLKHTLYSERRHGSTREYQAMPSLRDEAHDGVLCTFSNRLGPDRGKWWFVRPQAAWTVHHVQNHILLGHSPPASHPSRRIGPVL